MNKFGKGNKDFTAIQYGPDDIDVVDVIKFNDDMAVCAIHGEGPVVITKEQAMAFFDLVPANTTKSVKPVAHLLIEARKLINTPNKWTKDTYARTVKGSIEKYSSPMAVSFCSVGAIKKAGITTPPTVREKALRLLEIATPFPHGITAFNDNPTTKHEDVMCLFDRAINQAIVQGV